MDSKSQGEEKGTKLVVQYMLFTEYIVKLVDIYGRLIIHMSKILMFYFTFKGIGKNTGSNLNPQVTPRSQA